MSAASSSRRPFCPIHNPRPSSVVNKQSSIMSSSKRYDDHSNLSSSLSLPISSSIPSPIMWSSSTSTSPSPISSPNLSQPFIHHFRICPMREHLNLMINSSNRKFDRNCQSSPSSLNRLLSQSALSLRSCHVS
ncbi:hypothetical protein DERP_007495 [Dermatophagoides pteronyssinus]|uniref:Uncharacterized protein n=1 Tax=Dermatophagoides pteronyssinus TaxID=6956 RepID=A0ABQ8J4R5_DERPT|nr:hypothetical protein DERP_007495 [Dermatophagoides pteronyssinus]